MRSRSIRKSTFNHLSLNLRKISQEYNKQKEIDRENFILFLKLDQIKERKLSPQEQKGPKTLNFSIRKKKAEKIMNENYDFVRRFIIKPSFVSTRKLEEEYKQQQEYKKTISKANLHKRLINLGLVKKKPGQLPPLDSSLFEDINNSRTEVPSKLKNVLSNDSEVSLIQRLDENESYSNIKDSKSTENLKLNEKIIKNSKENNILRKKLDKSYKKINEINDEKDELIKETEISSLEQNKNIGFNDKKNIIKNNSLEKPKKDLKIQKISSKDIKISESIQGKLKNTEDHQDIFEIQKKIIEKSLIPNKLPEEKYQEDIISVSFLI